MDMGLRWGTASVERMYKDVKVIREKIAAKIIRNENTPSWANSIDRLRSIDSLLEKAEKELVQLKRMKGVK